MPTLEKVLSRHPEGEVKKEDLPWPIDTPGGRYWAEFDDEAPVTREGQLIFFAQFLHLGGRWERFVGKTPLRYTGNRGSAVVDVLGTAVRDALAATAAAFPGLKATLDHLEHFRPGKPNPTHRFTTATQESAN